MPRPRGPPDTVPRSRWNDTVRVGWNRASYRYRPLRSSADVFGHREAEYRAWLDPILRTLPRDSPVLDLGSGTGEPAARILSERFQVTGVDISDVQVRRARRLVPRARFVRADLGEVEFPPSSFAAVLALYSLIHVPREQHRRVIRRVARWLAPGGWFLAIVGQARYEGEEDGWLGSDAPMLWSHYDGPTYRRWLKASGFRIVRESFVPEGDGGHRMFLARTGRSSRGRSSATPPVVGSGRRARALPPRTLAHPPRGGPEPPLSRWRSGGTTRKSA
jgi:SAM-dependent methyltransferase